MPTHVIFESFNEERAEPGARANAHHPSFFAHDSHARISVLTLGERGSSLTFGKNNRMKILRLILILFMSISGVIYAASNDVSAVMSDMPVSSFLDLYEAWSGKKVVAPKEIRTMRGALSVKIEKRSKEEALRILEDTLLQQAGIQIVHAPDGTISARKVAPTK